jgi:hypothetical protein
MNSIRWEAESGGVLEFVLSHTAPLTFQDITGDPSKPPYEIELFSEQMEWTVGGERTRKPGRAKFIVQFDKPLTVFALVVGGWLPPPFVLPPHFLLDRNVVSTLRQLQEEAARHDQVDTGWWLKFFPVDALFHPILYAFEGSNQSAPTFEAFTDSFNQGAEILRNAFPGSSVATFTDVQYRVAYQQLVQVAARSQNEADFLLDSVPLIWQRVHGSKLRSIEELILAKADEHRLARRSFVVIAILSCLYEDRHGNCSQAARRIIKPRQRYSCTQAYNALSDLRHLEFFIASDAIPGLPHFSLCTCDKALALLWSGLLPCPRHADGVIEFTLSFTDELFPSLDDVGRSRLMKALQN